MRFSERHGFVVPRSAFQKDSLDGGTRNRLTATVIRFYLSAITPLQLNSRGEANFEFLITEFFKDSIDKATDRLDRATKMLVTWSEKCAWYSILDLLEFAQELDGSYDPFIEECNIILVEEKVGFRIINGVVTSIVNQVEIEAIEEALELPDQFAGAKAHLARSLELYSDKQNPDYRNSIKEAISAVESVAKVISKKPKATLADALKAIDKLHPLHGALKEALLKFYGYSSDKQGMRHSLLEESNVEHAEAKLMLVSCASFCNYMIELSD